MYQEFENFLKCEAIVAQRICDSLKNAQENNGVGMQVLELLLILT